MSLEADYWDLRFKGVERLYGGSGSLERLRASHVCVVGLGGVGSWTVEALVRSGVGSLTLMDLDEVCISNTNRQLHALEHTVGRTKASVLAERAALINPECRVNVREEWLTVPGALSTIRGELAERSDAQGGFAVVDAIDGVNEKAALIDACCALNLHIVTVGAAGGRADPSLLRIADLTLATNDPLISRTRQALRKTHGFPAGGPTRPGLAQAWGVPTVFSVEKVETGPKGAGSDCDRFGTACFVTGAFGFAAASVTVRVLAAGEPPPSRPGLSAARTPPVAPGSPPQPTASEAAASDGQQKATGGESGAADESGGTQAEEISGPRGAVSEQDASIGGDGGLAFAYDSHCHVLPEAASELRARLRGCCFVSTGEAEWSSAVKVSPQALGVHPWFVGEQTLGWLERLERTLREQPHALVGEIGLDRAPKWATSWEQQRKVRARALTRELSVWHDSRARFCCGSFILMVRLPPSIAIYELNMCDTFARFWQAFEGQLHLATHLGRPAIVHCVRAHGALAEFLSGCGSALPPVIVMHAYGGSLESARQLLQLPTKIYFGFSAQAARLKKAPAVMAALPAERLLLESDEHEAGRAASALQEALSLIAAARGWSEQYAAAVTAANAEEALSTS